MARRVKPAMHSASARSARTHPAAMWLALLLVFALALFLRHALQLNLDVSWGITMSDKILSGGRLYVDIIENNPPAAVFLYLPWVALARLLSIRPEIAIDAAVFAACGLSLWLSGCILRLAPFPFRRGFLAVVFAAALVLLPAQIFGEREHFAVILLLPALAIFVLRAGRIVPPWRWIAAAGIAAGLAACIKPHFALAVVFVAAAAAWSAKSWRPLLAPENFIAAGLAVAGAIATIVAYPEYLRDIVPLVLTVYVPVKAPLWRLLTHYAVPLWAAMLLMTVLFGQKAALTAPRSLLLAASCGFALAFAIQGKGWPYQSYPMLVTALCALVVAFAEYWLAARSAGASLRSRAVSLAAALIVASLAGGAYHWLNDTADTRALAARITALRPHPKMLCICADYHVAHPLVRQVGGTWVSRVGSLWITADALIRNATERLDPVTRFRLAIFADRDRNMLSEDIENGKPDIIVVERKPFDWKAWAESDPVLSRRLKAYREVETIGRITVLERKSPPPAAR